MDGPIDQVLNAIHAAGYHDNEGPYNGVGQFLFALLRSNDHGDRHAATVDSIADWIANLYKIEVDRLSKAPENQMNAKNLSPGMVSSFNFPGLAVLYAQNAPHLWKLICRLSDVSPTKAAAYMAEEAPDDPDADDHDNNPMRTPRQKALVATIAIGSITFSHSRNANKLQGLIGYWLFATRTGKRTIGVLNRLGISTSYSYVNMSLRSNARQVSSMLKSRAEKHPFFLTYDNMTNHNKVTGETIFNKAAMYCFTTGGIIYNRMPNSLAARLKVSIAGLQESGNLVYDQKIPGESAEDSMARKRITDPRNAALPKRNPAIRRNLLLKPNVDWNKLSVHDIIKPDTMSAYWPSVVKGLLTRELRKHFKAEYTRCEEELGIVGPELPHLFKIPVTHSDAHTLMTMEFDESTVAGNFEVLTDIACRQLNITFEELINRVIPTGGDQMTVVRLESGQVIRIRDITAHKFKWVKTLPGFLHLRMAVIHMIYISHMGRASADARDPGSMNAFITLLGRTRVKESCPDLNAAHDLLLHVGQGADPCFDDGRGRCQQARRSISEDRGRVLRPVD